MEEHQKQQTEIHKLELEQLQQRTKHAIPEETKVRQQQRVHLLQVKGEPQPSIRLKSEPRKEGYGKMKEIVKQQEAECQKCSMEQKRNFQNQ